MRTATLVTLDNVAHEVYLKSLYSFALRDLVQVVYDAQKHEPWGSVPFVMESYATLKYAIRGPRA